jgi:hypothetical protein
MNYKFISIAIVTLFVTLLAGAYVVFSQKTVAESKERFLANLDLITSDANAIESIPLQSIYRNGETFFHLNTGDANFEEGVYYTKEGYLGNGNSATLEEFLKSTGLTKEQAQTLATVMKKHNYIDAIIPDPNVSGPCANKSISSCRAIKFYTLPSFLKSGISNDGYIYIPFKLSDVGTEYLKRHFSNILPISNNWYAFQGEHI